MKEEKEQEEQKTEEEAELAETAGEAEVGEISEKEEEIVEEEAKAEEETVAPMEEEAKELLPAREEKVEEEEIVEERVYTIPLSKVWIVPPNKRAPRAMRVIRSFVVKHMKLEARKEGEEEEEVPRRLVISNEVNERVWVRGVGKPPRKIRVRATKDKEGNVTVYLAEGD